MAGPGYSHNFDLKNLRIHHLCKSMIFLRGCKGFSHMGTLPKRQNGLSTAKSDLHFYFHGLDPEDLKKAG